MGWGKECFQRKKAVKKLSEWQMYGRAQEWTREEVTSQDGWMESPSAPSPVETSI